MALRFADPAPDAYAYPLLIRHLLQSALDARSGREIVGSDGRRHDYQTLNQVQSRAAMGLGLGQAQQAASGGWPPCSPPTGWNRATSSR